MYPDRCWCLWRSMCLIDEALRVCAEGFVEDRLTGGVDFICLAVMDLIGRHKADTEMMMVLVVPVEEMAAERLCVLGTAEAFWELRLIFQCLEVAQIGRAHV